ncbi:MAG: SH3 domain-containing protein [Leptospirales bacterium]
MNLILLLNMRKNIILVLVLTVLVQNCTRLIYAQSHKVHNKVMICNITDGYLNLRRNASLHSPANSKIMQGEKVVVLEETKEQITIQEKTGYWYRVAKLNNKKDKGWVFSAYLVDLPVPYTLKSISSKAFIINAYPESAVSNAPWTSVFALFSPTGKTLAIQSINHFAIVKLNSLEKPITHENMWFGNILGFLPSGELLYSTDKATFLLNTKSRKSRNIMNKTFSTNNFRHGSFVIVSENLAVYLQAHSWEGTVYPILRYDLKTGVEKKGAPMFSSWQGQLSPKKNYIVFQYGDESTNSMEIYDIKNDAVLTFGEHFNMEKYFPDYFEENQSPIGWLEDGKKFLAGITMKSGDSWMILFDVVKKKIVWKKKRENWVFPADFQQLNNKTALLAFPSGTDVLELTLRTGEIKPTTLVKGRYFKVSSDQNKIAYFTAMNTEPGNMKPPELFIADVKAGTQTKILDLPYWHFGTSYKGMGVHPPVWSPENKFLLILGTRNILLIRNETEL